MTIPTDYLIEDTVSFLLVLAIIALFWFHPWHGAPRTR